MHLSTLIDRLERADHFFSHSLHAFFGLYFVIIDKFSSVEENKKVGGNARALLDSDKAEYFCQHSFLDDYEFDGTIVSSMPVELSYKYLYYYTDFLFIENNELNMKTYAENRDNQFLASIEFFLDLNSELIHFISSTRKGQVILRVTTLSHQRDKAIIRDIDEGIFGTVDVGDVTVVGRGGEIFHLLVSEDINCNEMALGVAVLSCLGGGDIDHLARAALDDDVSVLTDGTGLHGEGLGCTGIGRLEMNVVMFVVRHGDFRWSQ